MTEGFRCQSRSTSTGNRDTNRLKKWQAVKSPKIITIFYRHCVVMELVNGHTLQAVTEVPDPATLYDKLIKLLIKFANHGVIHGDFNEFNIMLDTQTAEPIIIDFPLLMVLLREAIYI